MFKLMIVGRRRGGMTVAQLHRYMVEEHGAMVVGFIAQEPALTPKRYVQNHVFDSSFRAPGDTPDPFTVARDFVTQVWFDSPAQAQAGVHAPFYLEKLQPDEDRFVDQTSVVKLPVIEREVVGQRDASQAGGFKLFVLHRCAPAVTPEGLMAATRALWEPLLADAALGIGRLVRNAVLQRPGEVLGVDLVDEVWFADEAALRALATHWQDLTDGPSLAAVSAQHSAVLLLARERVLFAGA